MTDDKKELLNFVSNAPLGKDLFEGKSQEFIAKAIVQDIKEGKNKVIGIDGGWGSGKSNIVKMVENFLLEDKYQFFTYDVWGHQEDLQRKNILWELIEFFEKKEKNGILKNLSNIKEEVKKITGKTVEKTHKQIPRLSFAVIILFFLLVAMPLLNSAFELFPNNDLKYTMISLYGVAFSILFIVAFCMAWRATKSEKGKDRFGACMSHLILFYKGKSTTTKNIEFEHETNPSISSFANLICEISNGIKPRKLILIFDNMDRLQTEKVKEFWSSLHTLFADRIPEICEDILVIVPFDREHIRAAFLIDSLNYGDDYINKTFNIVYRVSPPILSDWKKLFRIKWGEAKIKCSEDEYNRVIQAYDLLCHDITPRNIIVFINEFVAIKKQMQEDIPARYIALFILKKSEILYREQPIGEFKTDDPESKNMILQNPQKAILNKDFLGPLNFIYQHDPNLSKYIAALVYQIPSERAIEVVYSKQIKDALENADISMIKEIQEKEPHFNDLLDSIMIGLVNLENASIALGALDQERLGLKRQSKWNELHDLCKNAKLTINQDSLSESHKLLIQNISDKRSFIKQILNNIISQDDKTFNIVGYYDVLCGISDAIERFELNVNDLITARIVTAEAYLKLLTHTKEDCLWTGIKVNIEQLDEYLQKQPIAELKNIEAICWANKEIRYQLKKFCGKLQEFSSSNADNRKTLPLIIQLLTAVSPDRVNHGLSDDKVMAQFKGLSKTDLGYYDFLCMRIARSQHFSNAHRTPFEEALKDTDDAHIRAISNLINKHIYWGDMLINLSHMKQYPTYIAIQRYIITNWSGTHHAAIKNILPKFAEIINDIDIDAELFWRRLDGWKLSDMKITEVPITLPFSTLQTAIESETEIGCFCVQKTRDYLENLSSDEWTKRFSDHKLYGVREFLIVKASWASQLSECMKNVLCSIAEGKIATPARELWHELINYIVDSGHSVNSVFNSVKDSMLAGKGISVEQFIFFGPWLFQYAILTDKQDICRKIFPVSLLGNDAAITIILENKDKMPSILANAEDDKDIFEKAIREKITQDPNSLLKGLAEELHIKIEENETSVEVKTPK